VEVEVEVDLSAVSTFIGACGRCSLSTELRSLFLTRGLEEHERVHFDIPFVNSRDGHMSLE
jgi:hypothetical protein